MLLNSQENIDNSIIIKLCYNNNNYEVETSTKINASKLRQNIFSKYKINDSYILSYKNKIILKTDSTPLSILFKNDSNPLLFINDNNTILPSIKQNCSITINSKIPQQVLLNILNLFFQSKYLPLNANIKSPSKGIYIIKFSKPILATEFLNYFNKKLYKNKIINKNNILTIDVNKNKKKVIPKISSSMNQLPILKEKINKKSTSESDILFKNDKNFQLYKVIKENSKSDLISQQTISSGINKYHQSCLHTLGQRKTKIKLLKRNDLINDKYCNEGTYEGVYSFPFMSEEEKYNREKYLDKKNWINKKGFMVSIGKYKMKDNFIPNYVNATPSESPLNYRYRDINKNKWINRNGFIL